MSAVLDDDVGFDEPSPEQQVEAATTNSNAVAINNDMMRVQNALNELDRVAASLPAIAQQFPPDVVYEITTTKGMEAAKAHRAAWREPRITVEKARKMAKAPILALGKNIDARAARLTEQLLIGEEPIDKLIKAEEARKEEERQARINAEAGRILAIQEALAGVAEDVQIACGKSSADIRALLAHMAATQPEQAVYQEMMEAARAAWTAGIAKLETALKAKLWEEEQEAKRLAAEADRLRKQAEEDAERARVAAEQAAEAQRLAAQSQALAIGQRAMACMSKSASEIRDELNLLELTAYPAGVAEIVTAAHEQAVDQLKLMLQMAEQREAHLAAEAVAKKKADEALASLQIQAPPAAPVADGSQDSDDDAATPVAKAGQEPTRGDQREGMAPEACESAAGRGMDGAPALATPPDHESPGVGPMGVGHPADAGPAGEVPDGTLTALVDALALAKHIATAFTGKFPSQPKPSPEWWAEAKRLGEVASPELIEAIKRNGGEVSA